MPTKKRKSVKKNTSKLATLFSTNGRFKLSKLFAFLIIVGLLSFFGYKYLLQSHADSVTITGTPVGIADSDSTTGYWIVASDGGVFAEGTAPFYGSMGGTKLSAPITSIAATTDGKGYWLAGADGAVYAFGDAVYHGGVNNAGTGGTSILVSGARIVSIANDPNGSGYMLLDNFGHSYAFGNAAPYSISPWTTPTNETASSISFNSSGSGLYAITADGRVLSYGSVEGQGGYLGSTAGSEKWIGIASDPGTNGYYMASNTGGVYSESGAAFYGSATSNNPVGGIVGIATTSDGKGYWLLGGDGGVFAYGDASYQGRVTAPTSTPVSGPTTALTTTATQKPDCSNVPNSSPVGGQCQCNSGFAATAFGCLSNATIASAKANAASSSGGPLATSDCSKAPNSTLVNGQCQCLSGYATTPVGCVSISVYAGTAGTVGASKTHDCMTNFYYVNIGGLGYCKLTVLNPSTSAEITAINQAYKSTEGLNVITFNSRGVTYSCTTELFCKNN